VFRYYPSKNDIPWGQFDQTLTDFRSFLEPQPDELPFHRAVVKFNRFPADWLPLTAGHVSLALALTADERWLDATSADIVDAVGRSVTSLQDYLNRHRCSTRGARRARDLHPDPTRVTIGAASRMLRRWFASSVARGLRRRACLRGVPRIQPLQQGGHGDTQSSGQAVEHLQGGESTPAFHVTQVAIGDAGTSSAIRERNSASFTKLSNAHAERHSPNIDPRFHSTRLPSGPPVTAVAASRRSTTSGVSRLSCYAGGVM
jgi:hypothetical protein